MRALNRELVAQYDMNIKKYQYIRSNYYLETNKGKFVFRKVDVPKEQILFNYEVDAWLMLHEFSNINHIVTTRKKAPYVMQGEQIYVVQKYTDCEETDFKDTTDLINTVLILADFHKAATHIVSKIKKVDNIYIKNIYDYYLKRSFENTKLKKNITSIKQKSCFEMMFLNGCEQYATLEQMALEGISRELGEKLIENVRIKKAIAHRDYTYHTVNKTAQEEYIMSNLDRCGYDVQIIDLAHILGRIMQKNDWDIELLGTLIKAYDTRNPIPQDEFRVLKAMMIYPEKYNSICSKYISSKRRWNYSMFEQKWQKMSLYQDNQLQAAKIINKW